jgi:POT family proton-dependent oligopeptide transporter
VPAPVFFTLLLQNNWSGYLLAIVCVFAAQMVARIMIKARSIVARCGRSSC